jgi:hypothetical protein
VEKLRSHIIKWIALLAVTTGLAFCLIRPAETQHSRDSFTRWIQSLQAHSNSEWSPELRSELETLRHFDGDFQDLVQRASAIIKRHNGQFKLPFPVDGAPQEDLPKQLLAEWNFYYQLGDLFDGLPSTNVKPSATLLFPLWGIAPNPTATHTTVVSATLPQQQLFSSAQPHAIQPMINGIAIGAP